MHIIFHKYILSVIVFCLIIPASAAYTAGGVPDGNGPHINDMRLFEDTAGALAIREVSSPAYRNKFVRHDRIPNYGFTRSAVWVRLTAAGNPSVDTERILEVLYPALNLIEVYIPDGRGGYTVKTGGSRAPFAGREIAHRNSLFRVPVKAGDVTEVFVRMQSESALNFSIKLHDIIEFQRRDYIEQLFLGMFYGVLLIMLLYNLFLYFSVRDTSYLLYVCYTASNILFSLSIHGLAYEFLWPGAGEWAVRSHPFFTASTLLFAVLFSSHFLQIRKYSAPFSRFFLAMAVVIACAVAGALFCPYRYCIRANVILTYATLPVIITASVYAIRRGYRPARYFLAGWSFLIAGSLVYAMSHSGVIPRSIVTEFSVQIGTAIEVSLLALALGDRINTLRKEKEDFDRYRELDRVKTDFIANISHEIRTPLTLMLTPVWAILDGSRMEAPDRELFDVIGRNGSRLLALINDLLDFSKLDAGRMNMKVAHADIVKLVRDHAAAVKSACDLKRISVGISSTSERVMLYFDPEKMDSVMTNLFSNAIGFTGEGGRIEIRIDESDEEVRLEFEDTGCGIPAEDIDTIFDRFSQASSVRSDRPGGTGIGLALVREFLDLHGGGITAESRHIRTHPDSHGTVFRITLPKGKTRYENREDVTFCEDVAAQGVRYARMPRPATPGHTAIACSTGFDRDADNRPVILAIDDNADMHLLFRDILRDSYNLICATDAQSALDMLSSMEEPPDLIISDVMMPGMDGYELTRRVRSDRRYEGIPLILLTAKADTSMKIEGLETGATDYMAKPFNGRELIARVNAQLGMKSLRDRLVRSNNQLYAKLREAGKSSDRPPGPDIEDKIRIVTDFIRENYTADLSREGLASAVNMSADYLSRMFNRVTGMRLDEYINELRAADAAKRLAETDDTIIAIAMETGFESLRHFNRVFNKTYRMNPTDYRRTHR